MAASISTTFVRFFNGILLTCLAQARHAVPPYNAQNMPIVVRCNKYRLEGIEALC